MGRHLSRRHGHCRGFTLIEVLVVVVIVATVVGAAVLSIGGSGSRELENAAQRAQLRIRLACERALVSGLDIGFSLEQGAMRFGYLMPERWRMMKDSPQEELRERTLGIGIEVQLLREGVEAAQLDPEQPQLVCYSSGELTPFEMRFERSDVPERWTLNGQLDGGLELAREPPP